MVDPLFVFLGIKTTHIGGGLAGGTVSHIIVGGNWKQWVASVTTGVFVSGYLTPGAYFLVAHYFPSIADPGIEGSIGFLIGLTAMLICRGFITLAQRWSRNPWIPKPPGV